MQSLLALDHCVGIIGGKPKHSVYFVGFQGMSRMNHVGVVWAWLDNVMFLTDDKLVHLDPHFCQPATGVPSDPTFKDFDFTVSGVAPQGVL